MSSLFVDGLSPLQDELAERCFLVVEFFEEHKA